MDTQTTYRTPLIVVSLFMPSEAKTLAPKDIKRDIRRQPIFCKKFQKHQSSQNDQCNCKINLKPDFVIRGKEIADNSNNKNADESYDEHQTESNCTDDGELNCVDCCACFIEMERNAEMNATCVDKAELCVNFDKFQMDVYGNLPKATDAIRCSDSIDNFLSTHSILSTHRSCSPNTSRVIRITLNNKNDFDNTKK